MMTSAMSTLVHTSTLPVCHFLNACSGKESLQSMQPCSNLFMSRGVIQKAVRTQRPVIAASTSPAAPVIGRRAGSWLQLASATALVEELRGAQSAGRAGELPAGFILNVGPIPTEFPQPDVQPFPSPEPSVPGAPDVSPGTPPDTAPGTPPEVPPLISPPEPDTTEVPGRPSVPDVPSTPGPEILPDPGRGEAQWSLPQHWSTCGFYLRHCCF